MSDYRMRAARGADPATTPDRFWGSLRFFDTRLGVNVTKILPGEYHATGEPGALLTILGSCVAVCLHDARARIGGMNHFMLPDEGSRDSEADPSGRYGSRAMELLIDAMLQAGADRQRLTAKIFGGAAVLSSLATGSIGESNAAFVRAYLATRRIPVLAEDLEGLQPRKVLLYPGEGRVMVRRLAVVEASAEVAHEKTYHDRLGNKRVPHKVA